MGDLKAQGIILKHRDIREADRQLTVFTAEHGKIKVIAKGARKAASKLAGSLEPFILSKLTIIRGRSLDTVTGSSVLKNYRHLKNDVKKVFLAGYISEVVCRATKENQPEPRIFDLLLEVFDFLDSHDGQKNYPGTWWYFIWRFLSYLGYHPDLFNCAVTKKKISPGAIFFSAHKGGVISGQSVSMPGGSAPISIGALKILRSIYSQSLVEFKKIRLTQQLIKEINSLTKFYLSYTQEMDIPIKDFLIVA
ncbi:MAG: DNA repair protein RecO [Patescibacteria group bacterium]|jgi:DNA repair protein RecO (recombination protein O)